MPKEIKETDIQKEICEYLQTKGYFFWRQNQIPVFGRSMPKYSIKGVCDIIVVRGGKFIGIEVKRPAGFYKDRNRKPVQSDDQIIFQRRLEENGGMYFLVTSLDEIKKDF